MNWYDRAEGEQIDAFRVKKYPHLFEEALMDTDAQKRAESAFIKKERKSAEASSAWAEYQAKQAATDQNTERLRAMRLAREAEAVTVQRTPARARKRAPKSGK